MYTHMMFRICLVFFQTVPIPGSFMIPIATSLTFTPTEITMTLKRPAEYVFFFASLSSISTPFTSQKNPEIENFDKIRS